MNNQEQPKYPSPHQLLSLLQQRRNVWESLLLSMSEFKSTSHKYVLHPDCSRLNQILIEIYRIIPSFDLEMNRFSDAVKNGGLNRTGIHHSQDILMRTSNTIQRGIKESLLILDGIVHPSNDRSSLMKPSLIPLPSKTTTTNMKDHRSEMVSKLELNSNMQTSMEYNEKEEWKQNDIRKQNLQIVEDRLESILDLTHQLKLKIEQLSKENKRLRKKNHVLLISSNRNIKSRIKNKRKKERKQTKKMKTRIDQQR